MVSVSQPQPDNEPTPDFDARGVEVIQSWNRGDLPFKEAISFLTELRDEAIKTRHLVNEARAEQLLGYLQHYRGNLNISIEHNDRARRLYDQCGNYNRVATMDLNQGENYRYKGDFNRALQLYRAAYDNSDQIATKTMAAANEGLVLVTMGRNTKARESFETALELVQQFTEEDRDPAGLLCEIHHGMAEIFLREGDLEFAWNHALKALAAAQETGEPLQYGYANRTLGEVITGLGSSPDERFSSNADDYFREALQAFREINAEVEMAKTMYAQALSLAARGRRTTAARKLQQVMIIFTRLDMVDDAARAAEAQLSVI